MSYRTTFTGRFLLNRTLDLVIYRFLVRLNVTRRMARNVNPQYGVEGEFYVDGKDAWGQGGIGLYEKKKDPTIIDPNRPPVNQPSLWCPWRPSKDRKGIEWDGQSRGLDNNASVATAWIEYIDNNILKPKGYTLKGEVEFQGEDPEDTGKIVTPQVSSPPLKACTTVTPSHLNPVLPTYETSTTVFERKSVRVFLKDHKIKFFEDWRLLGSFFQFQCDPKTSVILNKFVKVYYHTEKDREAHHA